MCQAVSIAVHAEQDPGVGLKPIWDQYEADVTNRFKWLIGEIKNALIEENALGGTVKKAATNTLRLNAVYTYPRAADKASAFMRWLAIQEDAGVLEVLRLEGRSVVAHTGWQNTYIKRSYVKGVEWAELRMQELGLVPVDSAQAIGAVLSAPVHADALGLMFTRAFDQLNGITQTMSQQISRVLVEGMVAGKGPRQIATMMAGRVEGIGIARARTLARTETAFAQSEASLNRYTDYRVSKVFWIFGGGPCPQNICPPNNGVEFTIAEAHGMQPAHPNCQCAWGPVV